MAWVRLNYEAVTGRAGYSDFYKKDIDIKILDGPGAVVSQWTLKNAWPNKFDFGTLDYSKDDLVDIDISIRYDYPVLLF